MAKGASLRVARESYAGRLCMSASVHECRDRRCESRCSAGVRNRCVVTWVLKSDFARHLSQLSGMNLRFQYVCSFAPRTLSSDGGRIRVHVVSRQCS
jgi:hypothetical protein